MRERITRNMKEIDEEIKGWEDSKFIRTKVYEQLKKDVKNRELFFKKRKSELNKSLKLEIKNLERELKLVKKTKNKAQRDLVEAKKEVVKWKKRRVWIPSATRSWAKNNIGKVLNKLEEGVEK